VIKNPLIFENEIRIRNLISKSSFDISCIIIVDVIPEKKIEILLQSEIFDDVREVIMEE
jgi:hypothetical protein